MDPYLLRNGLGPDYRPLGAPLAEVKAPPFPSRLRAFTYACALVAEKESRAGQGG